METSYRPGQRIELHPATDLWMRGARYGTVEKVGRKWVSVRLDNGRVVRLAPRAILSAVDHGGQLPAGTGYHDCECRDCFELVCGEEPLCHACRSAGCEPDHECQAEGAYEG